MQFLSRILSRNNPSTYYANLPKYLNNLVVNPRLFSADGGSSGGGVGGGWDDGNVSSWSTGITKDQFDGEVVGHQVTPSTHTLSGDGGGGNDDGGGWRRGREDYETADNSPVGRMEQKLADLSNEAWQFDEMFDGWEDREEEIVDLWAQIEEPGARGSYLKDSEKAEMYKKHKEDPEVYNIERLAKDYRIMRQRVMAILWLKEMEEEEEKKLGEPLDDSVELLLDTFPEFFKSHDREFHVASLPYKPDFKVMPEGWDGTTRDPDEVHYEISKKEDDMLYEEFTRKFNFNKLKFKNKIKVHKYSRRRPDDGWSLTVEKLGPEGKRGPGGGWKFVSLPDGSTRPLNDLEKTFVKRETPRRRKRILP